VVFAWVLHKSKAGQIVRRAVLIPDGRKDSRLQKLRNLVLIFDGAGPAVFAVAGTPKALGYGLNPMMAALLGMLTGIGGGMLRDVLTAKSQPSCVPSFMLSPRLLVRSS
jgi:uncharacterized membrane protein YeiH